MMKTTVRAFFLAVVALFFLSACGGAGQIPVAVITADPLVAVSGQQIAVSGASSYDEDGTIELYSWTSSSGDVTTTFESDQSDTSFTAPQAPATITFELIVTDNQGNQSRATTLSIPVSDSDAGTPSPSGAAAVAIFVSNSGSDDPGTDGTLYNPAATIGRGIELAQQKGFKTVYVMTGIYEEEVVIPRGMAIHGCIAGVDEDGNPIIAQNNLTTTIRAPSGSRQAILVDDVVDVSIDCFNIEGGESQPESRGITIENSSYVDVANVNVFTPGASGALCRDISIVGSDLVSIENNTFRNGGLCDDYIGIELKDSSETDLGADSSGNDFTIDVGGAENYIKAAQVVNSSDVRVMKSKVRTTGGSMDAGTSFSAINANDVQDIRIMENEIYAEGSGALKAVSLLCTNSSLHAWVLDNDIEIGSAHGDAAGISVLCAQPAAVFDIERNFVYMEPYENEQAALSGISLSSLYRPVDVRAVNNVVIMATVNSDKADKEAVAMSRMGLQSTMEFIHNCFIVTGAQGDIYSMSTDDPNAQFTTVNNLMFVFGGAAQNALFKMPSQCAVKYCAQTVLSNLINSNIGGMDLPMAFYYDTAQVEGLPTVNECDVLPAPAHCSSHEVTRTDNILQLNMHPTNFDFASGMLIESQVQLVKDNGFGAAGVAGDIDGVMRSDGSPDIGAHEY